MIWISQWLCPSRHCAIAVAWDDEHTTAKEAEDRGEDFFRTRIGNRWCGICGHELRVEHGSTDFKTMAEAQPHLQAVERANLLARRFLGGKF